MRRVQTARRTTFDAAAELAPAERVPPQPGCGVRVAYIAAAFPVLSETFVLYEMLAAEKLGAQVELFPLRRRRARCAHPEARAVAARAHFAPFLNLEILRAQLHYLRRAPRAYLAALWTVLAATFGSVRYFSYGLLLFPKAVWFARRMRELGVTHVHAHFCSHPAVAAFVIRRLEGIPYSFTAHGSDLHRERRMLREKLREADFAVAISAYNRRRIELECGADAQGKVHVIHCGVDPGVFAPRRTPREPGPFRILCTGSLHEVKGQRYLIDACRMLAQRGLDFECCLIGSGPDARALARRIRRAGLASRVRLLGSLPRDAVAAELARADVLAAPSVPTASGRREGIPVALMEALASEVPVVASRLSGIPELVGDGLQGLLVAPRDAVGLANALARLAGDAALRSRLGRAGRRKVLREFDQQANAAALVARFRRRGV
jgi:glycosyltransferase involved in cell wall biosynthesis